MGLETERLFLRKLTDADCTEFYLSSLNDAEVSRFLETRHAPQTLESIRAFVALVNSRDDEHLYGIFLRDRGRHIGNLKIGPIHPLHHVGDVSLWIGDKSCWGKGYATEAIAAAGRHAFDALGVRKLSASMYEQNQGSYNAFIKAGYVYEGCRRAHYAFEGGRANLLLAGLTPEDR